MGLVFPDGRRAGVASGGGGSQGGSGGTVVVSKCLARGGAKGTKGVK